MPWEHKHCGTIDFSVLRPLDCKVCFSPTGWRRVNGPAPVEAVNLRTKKGPGKTVKLAKRKRIYERDYYTCQGTCKRHLPPGHPDHSELTLDHRVPLVKGGTNDDKNLQTMCRPCNVAKGDSDPA